jgi:hypothetical protein
MNLGDAKRKRMVETLAPAVSAVKSASKTMILFAVVAVVSVVLSIVALVVATRKAMA